MMNKEYIENNKMVENCMLSVQGILTYLNVTQKIIDESYFLKRKDFEIKSEYDILKNKPNEDELYKMKVEIKTKRQNENVKNPLFDKKNLFEDSGDEEDSSFLKKKKTKKILPIMNNNNNNDNQIRTNRTYRDLYESFERIFGNKINEYKIVEKTTRNRSPTFTYIESIVTIVNEIFLMKKEDEKASFIKFFIKKIHNEVHKEGNYQKFYYHKRRGFKKETLQFTLNQALGLNNRMDMDNFYLLQQYISDYLGLNTYIIEVLSDGNIDFTKTKAFLTREFGGKINPSIPSVFIIRMEDIYYPIVHENDEQKSIFVYSRDKEIEENVWSYLGDEGETLRDFYNIKCDDEEEKEEQKEEGKYKIGDVINMKLDELQEVSKELGISIEKTSEKTGKKIKRTKAELLLEIGKYI
jgi:hypothetical protein